MRILFLLICIILISKSNFEMPDDSRVSVEGKVVRCYGITDKESAPSYQKSSTTSCANKVIFEINVKANYMTESKKVSRQVDYITDATTGAKLQLLENIRLDLNYEQASEVYDLEFLHLVNGEATEIIVDMNQSSSMCGYMIEDNYIMPFSQGFNCSCNGNKQNLVSFAAPKTDSSSKNVETEWGLLMKQSYTDTNGVQQLKSVQFKDRRKDETVKQNLNDDLFVSYPLFESNDNGEVYFDESSQDVIDDINSEPFLINEETIWKQNHPGVQPHHLDKVQEAPIMLSDCDKVLEGVSAVYLNFPDKATRIDFCHQAVLGRGSQRCTWDPLPNQGLLNTAHCLRLSQLWYAVYSLRHARVQQDVTVNVMRLQNSNWHEISDVKQRPDLSRLTSYQLFSSEKSRLLIPQPVTDTDPIDFPELSGSPEELMILDTEQLSADGRECNKAGTSFEAFATEPAHCFAPAGSCVRKNQPQQLRREDEKSRQKGEVGNYMLYNFASLPKEPLRVDPKTAKLQLVVHPLEPRPISLHVEFTFPNLFASLGKAVTVQLTDIEVDARSETNISASVTLQGRQAARLAIQIARCGTPSCTPPAPRRVVISSGATRVVDISFACAPNPVLQYTCQVEVEDEITKQIVGSREFTVLQRSLCSCRGPCNCVCDTPDNTRSGRHCTALSEAQLLSAGFILETVKAQVGPFTFASYYNIPFIQVLAVIVLLMLIGTIKALLGLLGCKCIELFGLNTFLKHYMPKMNKRSTQEWGTRFVLNAHIFLLAPFLFLHWIFYYCFEHLYEARYRAKRRYDFDTDETIPIQLWHKQNCINKFYEPAALESEYENSYDEEEIIQHLYNLQRSTESDHRHQQNGQDQLSYELCAISERDEETQEEMTAHCNFDKHVSLLCETKFVYRHLNKPIGDLDLPPDTKYCVRGYFQRCSQSDFQFIVPPPMIQYWGKSGEEWIQLKTLISLTPSHFTAFYCSNSQVLEDGDILPSKIYKCINEK